MKKKAFSSDTLTEIEHTAQKPQIDQKRKKNKLDGVSYFTMF